MPTIDHDIQTMPFRSILTPRADATTHGRPADEGVLHDLALDQVFTRLVTQAPAAADAFRTLCVDEDEVRYRQEVFTALVDAALRGRIEAFLGGLERADRADAAASGSHDAYGRQLWRLEAVLRYTDAVQTLDDDLHEHAACGSRALRGLAQHVSAVRCGAGFTALGAHARACREELDALDDNVLIRGARVSVARTDGESDLRDEVLDTFARFRGTSTAKAFDAPASRGLDHVQGWILEQAARVHPDAFAALADVVGESSGYRDTVIGRFAQEVWFYLAYLQATAPLVAAGLPLSMPEVSASTKELDAHDTYDLALAALLIADGAPVVCNDMRLAGTERIIVVSGPNQRGKSTTARTFGQLHHLAGIGCPVPGRRVRIQLCDQVLTAFEREEQLDDLQGRLGAEIERMHAMLGRMTARTALVLNEAFSSTALADARILTRDVLERILAADAIALCVTFIDELSRIDERTVSMVSTVDPADPAVRTFHVERRFADGRAYARALAAAHGLSAAQIRERMNRQPGAAARTGKEEGR